MTDETEANAPWWRGPVAHYPSPDTLAWAAEAIGRGAVVVRGRRLKGGLISSVYALTVQDREGRRHQVVLRRHLTGTADRRAGWIQKEAKVLQALEATDVPAPKVLAFDPTGEAAGGFAALLMTRLPGGVFLAPTNPHSWLQQMASVLVRIHAVNVGSLPRRRERPARTKASFDWASRPELWEQAVGATAGEPPRFQPGFTHGDYQHFNMVWSHGRLTGVVDWESGAVGPPDMDVGHCRLNLAVLFSPTWAEQFRLAYESEAGRKVNPRQDLLQFLNYSDDWQQFIPIQVAGRAPVDTDSMTTRVEDLISLTLDRL